MERDVEATRIIAMEAGGPHAASSAQLPIQSRIVEAEQAATARSSDPVPGAAQFGPAAAPPSPSAEGVSRRCQKRPQTAAVTDLRTPGCPTGTSDHRLVPLPVSQRLLSKKTRHARPSFAVGLVVRPTTARSRSLGPASASASAPEPASVRRGSSPHATRCCGPKGSAGWSHAGGCRVFAPPRPAVSCGRLGKSLVAASGPPAHPPSAAGRL